MTTNQTKRFVLKNLKARKLTSRWTMEEMDAIVERTITPELRDLWAAVRGADGDAMSPLERVNARHLLNYVVRRHNQLTDDH